MKKTTEFKKFNVTIENLDGKAWINTTNKDGGTVKQPYGFASIEELKQLKNNINAILRGVKKWINTK